MKESDSMLLDYSVIGKRIREARKKQNLKQEELADKLEVSVPFMSRVERGTSKINLKRLTQIADILNISPGELLTGYNIGAKDYLKEDFAMLLEKCTPQQQKLIYQITEVVSKIKFEN